MNRKSKNKIKQPAFGRPKSLAIQKERNKTWFNYSWQVELAIWFCVCLLNCIVGITWCLSWASLVPAKIRPRVFIFNNASFATSLRCLRSTWKEKFCKDKLHHGQQSANGQKRHSKDRKKTSLRRHSFLHLPVRYFSSNWCTTVVWKKGQFNLLLSLNHIKTTFINAHIA